MRKKKAGLRVRRKKEETKPKTRRTRKRRTHDQTDTRNNQYCTNCVHQYNNKCLLGNAVPYPSNFCCVDRFPNTHNFQLQQKHIEMVRKGILKAQKNICPICKKKIDSPVLDHHHKKRIKGTGKIRGVLCRTCNVFIAKSENSATRYRVSQKELPSVLRNMADYLEREQYQYIHPSDRPKTPKLTKVSYNKMAKALKLTKYAVPEFPKSGNLTQKLKTAFDRAGIEPQFYKG